jgi:hypothetical protein
MGFFGDLWSGIKNVAGNVWSGIKKGAGAVYDVVRKPIDAVVGVGNMISKIPVLGTIAAPLVGAARGAQSILDQGKMIGDVVKAVGLKEGGMVKKYYQA